MKFAENETFKCLLQPLSDDVLHNDDPIKGKWNEEMFVGRLGGKAAPIVVELGCGHGDYTMDLALRRPECNYIGVDIKGARLWSGAKKATLMNLPNVAFLRTRIEFIASLFGEGEVSEIWLTFSDPQPKSPNRRLTAPVFLDRYRKFLKMGGIVHLKTDSQELHEYTLEVIKEQGLELLCSTNDLYALPSDRCSGLLARAELREVQTHYEKMFLKEGKSITYLAFRL